MMKAVQKSSENTNTKTKTMTKTTTKTKTQKKCLKHPTYAIFLKSWWLTHSKYDDRYLTLVILFTPVTLVTLVTLFQSYLQFYWAECITVSVFLFQVWAGQRPDRVPRCVGQVLELHLGWSTMRQYRLRQRYIRFLVFWLKSGIFHSQTPNIPFAQP